jgi:arsenate reductase (glutaredoxin)
MSKPGANACGRTSCGMIFVFFGGWMTVRLFGIAACDSVKKARRWLADKAIDYEFVDLRNPPLALEVITQWHAALGAALVNTRSTTYRQLAPQALSDLASSECSVVLHRHPALIKRPILQINNQYFCGFNTATYQSIFLRNL